MRESKNENGTTTDLELGKVNLCFEETEHRNTSDRGNQNETQGNNEREQNNTESPRWNNGTEFLMSCIAMSVGLGNIWRFPFTAFQNGRGAFLLSYFIVLTFVGRPLYYLEMALGQFSSKGCLEVWECVPLLKGIGYGQTLASSATVTYYCALMAITLFYLFVSFSSQLPWTKCKPEWDNCFDSYSEGNKRYLNRTGLLSSSELYFVKEVLHEKSTIDDGIGLPDWKLSCCLLLSWIILFLLVVKGVQSSGKAAYFLAVFPYIVLICLMIRGCILPGAGNGILFFVRPEWNELLNPKTWYAAVTQAFFSLGVSFGSLITYSSYNDVRRNIHRDALIVTVLDTFTSVIAGITTFAILGNLAYELGVSDISEVTKGSIGLAFISYPEAISKMEIVPQFFAVIFFFMLYVLGAGSAVSYLGMVIKIFKDRFPKTKTWKISMTASLLFFVVGLVYLTPGGQFIINLVDYYAASFNIFIIACVEIIGISWIYGFKNVCLDVEFMLRSKVGLYWKLCWGFFTPVTVIAILIYTLANASPLEYNNHTYPTIATAAGWFILVIEFIQIPLWAVYQIYKKEGSICQRIVTLAKPSSLWGPCDANLRKEWEDMKSVKQDSHRL